MVLPIKKVSYKLLLDEDKLYGDKLIPGGKFCEETFKLAEQVLVN